MRFVQLKSAEQQAQLMQHRARDLLMCQRTQLINAMRSHLAELGIIAPQGREGVKELLAVVTKDANTHLPNDARASLIVLAAQLQALQTTIGAIEKRITVQHRANKDSKRLQTIPGIGVIGASAITATVANPRIFRSGRDFAAWIGLTPRQMSTGGKSKLGPISKRGDRYLRRILVVGAVSTLRRAKLNPQRYPWVTMGPLISFAVYRSRTPGPPPFSSMNSSPAFSSAKRILVPVSWRPPKAPSSDPSLMARLETTSGVSHPPTTARNAAKRVVISFVASTAEHRARRRSRR